jgi:hypothetical protein
MSAAGVPSGWRRGLWLLAGSPGGAPILVLLVLLRWWCCVSVCRVFWGHLWFARSVWIYRRWLSLSSLWRRYTLAGGPWLWFWF